MRRPTVFQSDNDLLIDISTISFRYQNVIKEIGKPMSQGSFFYLLDAEQAAIYGFYPTMNLLTGEGINICKFGKCC